MHHGAALPAAAGPAASAGIASMYQQVAAAAAAFAPTDIAANYCEYESPFALTYRYGYKGLQVCTNIYIYIYIHIHYNIVVLRVSPKHSVGYFELTI